MIGDKGMGKSSFLAAAAKEGLPVLTDDVLVIDGMTAFAGPRCVDLRAPAVDALGLTAEVEVVRGDRWRYKVPPCPETSPLAGWIELAWGDLSISRTPASVALKNLAAQAGWLIPPPDPKRLLDLASLPMYRLTRKPNWTFALDDLLDAISG
ncbi:MAG: hypothetical protein LC723_14210 [Actinobacteria bacterium]|nr:hypothetical protein [Actinomycetota bacterium]